MCLAVRRASRADIPAIRALTQATYGDSDAYNDWFYANCFDSAAAYVTMAEDGLAATCMMLPLEMVWRGRAYPAGMNYGAAVAPAHRGQGLIKAQAALANEALRASGASHAIAFINLAAHRPWQSIGYAPAFPMRIREEAYEKTEACDIRPARPFDLRERAALSALYARAFEDYAYVRRADEDWRSILAEYALDGGTLLLRERGAVAGYCVYARGEHGLVIHECVCPDARGARLLRMRAMRNAGVSRAEVHEACTPENAGECVPIGIIKRLSPGGMPDFPYEKGYLNLFHM